MQLISMHMMHAEKDIREKGVENGHNEAEDEDLGGRHLFSTQSHKNIPPSACITQT